MAISTLARQSEDKYTRQAYQRRQDEIYFYNKNMAEKEQAELRTEQAELRTEQAERRAKQAEEEIEKLRRENEKLQAQLALASSK